MSDRNALLGANVVHLSICYQHLTARINRTLEPSGLNMSQLSILTHFSRMPPDHIETVTHLAHAMEMNQPMVTKAVKAMHSRGLIEKKAAPEDSRVSHLYLTAEGQKVLHEAQSACLPLLETAFSELNQKELGQLVGLLSKLKQGLLG